MKQHIKLARRCAERSTFRQKLGCVIFSGSTVLETGTNQLRHQGAIRTTHWPNSLHAELDAISRMIRSGRTKQLAGASMLICRVRKDGSYGLALPCKDCMRCILALKLKSVYYTNDDQQFSCIKL